MSQIEVNELTGERVQAQCGCDRCRTDRDDCLPIMVLCSECGNKRCPHAMDHRYVCNGSNEPNQEAMLAPIATPTLTITKPRRCKNCVGQGICLACDGGKELVAERDRLRSDYNGLSEEYVNFRFSTGREIAKLKALLSECATILQRDVSRIDSDYRSLDLPQERMNLAVRIKAVVE